jgi:hypothetical protein
MTMSPRLLRPLARFQAPITVQYLIAGGGSGGDSGDNEYFYGSGGAAGVQRSGTATLARGTSYSIVVGAGGAGVDSPETGNPGSSSSAFNITATGGYAPDMEPSAYTIGGSNDDFNGAEGEQPNGGGGAGAGGNASGYNGGSGASSSITGTAVVRGGGGIGYDFEEESVPGSGGGGSYSFIGKNGAANTGSGGGGGQPGDTAGNGGSGIVIVRSSVEAASTTGSPSVTTDGAFFIYTFTGSGSITF